jgi:ribonuclease HI
MSYVLFFDGCSKGNPGIAGSGAVIYKDNEEIWSKSEFLDKQTNNYAEYKGLIAGLEYAVEKEIKSLIVKGDSMLVIKQMCGVYKVKSENLVNLYEHALELKDQFESIEFIHVYREENVRADELANELVLTPRL